MHASPAWKNKPASPAALAFLDKMAAMKDPAKFTAPLVSVLTFRNANPGEFKAGQASWAIDALKALPWKPKEKAADAQPDLPLVGPGFYLKNGEVFKVRASKEDPSRRYAMVLVIEEGAEKGRFAYKAGAIKGLREEHRLTLEQAKEMGHQTGYCMICGAALTDAKSVAQGIGPVCIKKVAGF